LLLQESQEAIHQAEEMEVPAKATKQSFKKKKKNNKQNKKTLVFQIYNVLASSNQHFAQRACCLTGQRQGDRDSNRALGC